jgi:hypothetical protein
LTTRMVATKPRRDRNAAMHRGERMPKAHKPPELEPLAAL